MALLLPTELEINPSLPQPFTPMAAMPGVTDIGKSWQLRRGRVQVMHGRYDSPDWTWRNERESLGPARKKLKSPSVVSRAQWSQHFASSVHEGQ
ncbi:hypothetical protein PAL_GLEAN10018734 [Pteropus alecto]|uniref:Uncharacterized protein n=1 Tax=Pteropus alecto TaxID=9402 RepID=L5L0H9_PTEAL|nr:hypothetical protein PAL_GLEAN10018734 [Pteropus alecto]